MQVLQVFLAGKGHKNLEIYLRKQYLKAQLGCYNIKIFPAKYFGYDISFSNEYFCLLSLCCTSSFFYDYDFPCFFKIT